MLTFEKNVEEKNVKMLETDEYVPDQGEIYVKSNIF